MNSKTSDYSLNRIKLLKEEIIKLEKEIEMEKSCPQLRSSIQLTAEMWDLNSDLIDSSFDLSNSYTFIELQNSKIPNSTFQDLSKKIEVEYTFLKALVFEEGKVRPSIREVMEAEVVIDEDGVCIKNRKGKTHPFSENEKEDDEYHLYKNNEGWACRSRNFISTTLLIKEAKIFSKDEAKLYIGNRNRDFTLILVPKNVE